jgi:hypothetical protein
MKTIILKKVIFIKLELSDKSIGFAQIPTDPNDRRASNGEGPDYLKQLAKGIF